MKLRGDLLEGIEEFLGLVPSKSRRRGREYFEQGAVLGLQCVEPDHLFSAVVRGGEDYEVGLDFEHGAWAAECSCPVAEDCKHIVAAFLALQARGVRYDQGAGDAFIEVEDEPWERSGKSGRNGGKGSAGAGKGNRVQQPRRSALRDKLTEHLGRELTAEEARFIRQAQGLFASVHERELTESDLIGIAGRQDTFDYWKHLAIWPEFPPDDYQFWLYVARELQRREWGIPPFMEGITDVSLVEPKLREWERGEEIEKWKNWFREFDGGGPAPEAAVLELRLAILPEAARLQWRVDGKGTFSEFKQTHGQRFARLFEEGTLKVTPESLPLWSATFKPWNYESWWLFKYSHTTANPGLNRTLRLALAPDRVVTADGQPLPRIAEPLRLDLRAPEDAGGDYELKLTREDGSPPPKILCTLRGSPTLYLSEGGLFTGPCADLLDTTSSKLIPAPALETADGLRFLHRAEAKLPERLAQRIKTVPVTVTISCEVKLPYEGSQIENIVVSVAAKAPGLKTEHFTAQGWQAERQNYPSREGKAGREQKEGDGIIVHDRSAQRHFPRVLEGLPELKFGGYEAHWFLRLTKKTPEAFVAWLKALPTDVEVLLDPELATLRDEPMSGDVSLDVAEAGMDWFDLKVILNVSETTLTPEELKLLLNARGGYVRLGKKGWRRLQFNFTAEEDEQMARLGLDARDFTAEPQRFHAFQLADDAAKKFLAPELVEKIQRRAGELKARVTPPLPTAIQAQMRSYQTDGFHFLAYLTENRFGGVLADDMGLGKTLQTLAWLAWLRDGARAEKETAPATENCSLVVCPKSVMDNWRAEAQRFYPGLAVRLWKGEGAKELSAARKDAGLVVMNYAQLRALSPDISRVSWLTVILDEAQYIKNPDSQTAQVARGLQAGHRLALTGTPIENRLLDLWSIFGFAMPGALGNRAHFVRRFNGKEDPLARRRLAARVRPFLLRRTKAQVAKDLPERIEEDLLCEMEGKQETLYRAELKRARQMVLGLKTNQQLNKERFNILTSLLRLRQICCHPALVDGKLREAESAKVSALEDLLEPLMEEGHKTLVFSQFVTMLDLLRERVTERKWPHFYLAGETENRGELVEKFQAAEGGAVFLISLKAGGFGLNLTAASYVVLFDPWWNPAVENQAIDRTHRIGQKSNVIAYRLLMRESIEEKIRALQKQKAALANDVLGEERFSQSLTLDDLRFLLAE